MPRSGLVVDLRGEGTGLEGRSEDGRLLEVQVSRGIEFGEEKGDKGAFLHLGHSKWLIIPGSSHLEPVSGERGIRWSYSGT